MSGDPTSRDWTSIFWLAVLIVGMVVVLGLIGGIAWPKIESNFFATPTPVVDRRPLRMTNAQMDACHPGESAVVLGSPLNAEYIVPAITSLASSGVIRDAGPMLRRAAERPEPKVVGLWVWTQTDGLSYLIVDVATTIVYEFEIRCWYLATEDESYPLFESVILRKSEAGEESGR